MDLWLVRPGASLQGGGFRLFCFPGVAGAPGESGGFDGVLGAQGGLESAERLGLAGFSARQGFGNVGLFGPQGLQEAGLPAAASSEARFRASMVAAGVFSRKVQPGARMKPLPSVAAMASRAWV